jgi:hypothetical protein
MKAASDAVGAARQRNGAASCNLLFGDEVDEPL